jgi:hypothetical protein
MLRDRQLHALVRVGTSKDDFAGQIGYCEPARAAALGLHRRVRARAFRGSASIRCTYHFADNAGVRESPVRARVREHDGAL